MKLLLQIIQCLCFDFFSKSCIAIITIADVKKTIPPKVAMLSEANQSTREDEKSGNPAPTLRYSDVNTET